MPNKKPILDNVITLLVIGVLAGAVGGLGVGLLQLHSLQTASSTAGAPTK